MESKKGLHPRNIHNESYPFGKLIKTHPELAPFVKKNQYDILSVDFSDARAVLNLNQALISYYYQVNDWSVPKGHLCPPIPSRANYIHYIADLLAEELNGPLPVGTKIKGLDIGTGMSCIYPLLGNSIYGWKFVGTDINSNSINHAKKILNSNPSLKKNIKLRFQKSKKHIFKDLFSPDEKFDFTMCNPPFFSSEKEALKANQRKNNNLGLSKNKPANFGGKDAELWCPGGETEFITNMIKESVNVKNQCRWFSTLVSQKANLTNFYQLLKTIGGLEIKTIEMNQGQKISHILAWSF